MLTAALFTIAKRLGATKLFITEWMHKQNVAYTFSGIVFTLKNEGNSDMS